MLRIWALGCLVWFSMFRTHSPLLSPLILRMLSFHANARFLVSKELSNTNQAILLRNCCTHSFGRRQVTAMRPHWIPYDRPHNNIMLQHPTPPSGVLTCHPKTHRPNRIRKARRFPEPCALWATSLNDSFRRHRTCQLCCT